MEVRNDAINDYGIGMVASNFKVFGRLVHKYGDDWHKHAKCNLLGTRILDSWIDPRSISAEGLYAVLGTICRVNLRRCALYIAVIKTYLSFERIVNSELTDSEVTDWSNQMHPVLKKQIFLQLLTVKKAFEDAFHLNNTVIREDESKYDSPVNSIYIMNEGVFEKGYEMYQKLKKRQRVIDLHDTTNYPAPESALWKVARNEFLNRKEEVELKIWLEGLNMAATANRSLFQQLHFCGRDLNSRRLHKMLAEFLGEERHLLPKLEVRLKKMGLWVLDQKDHKQVKLRNKWREGLLIKTERGELHLKKEIREEALKPDDRREVYALSDYPDKVAAIYWNQALGWMEIAEQFERENLLPWPNTVKMDRTFSDPKGKFHVMDRMMMTLSSIEWEETINIEELKCLESIGVILKQWAEHQVQPERLKLSDFGWLANGSFVSTRYFVAVPMQYTKLLDFLLEIAKGKEWVIQQLMILSDLNKCIEYRYFKTLLAKKADPLKLLQLMSKDFDLFKDKNLADRGEAFLREIGYVEREVIDKINQECLIKELEEMKIEIWRQIERYFAISQCYGIVPKRCFDWVHQEILKSGKFPYTERKLEEKLSILAVRSKSAPERRFKDDFYHEVGIYDSVIISQIQGKLISDVTDE